MAQYTINKPVGVIGETFYAWWNDTVLLGEYDTEQEARDAVTRHAEMTGRMTYTLDIED